MKHCRKLHRVHRYPMPIGENDCTAHIVKPRIGYPISAPVIPVVMHVGTRRGVTLYRTPTPDADKCMELIRRYECNQVGADLFAWVGGKKVAHVSRYPETVGAVHIHSVESGE